MNARPVYLLFLCLLIPALLFACVSNPRTYQEFPEAKQQKLVERIEMLEGLANLRGWRINFLELKSNIESIDYQEGLEKIAEAETKLATFKKKLPKRLEILYPYVDRYVIKVMSMRRYLHFIQYSRLWDNNFNQLQILIRYYQYREAWEKVSELNDILSTFTKMTWVKKSRPKKMLNDSQALGKEIEKIEFLTRQNSL